MIVDKVWKLTSTVRVGPDPRSPSFVFLEKNFKSQETWDLFVECVNVMKKRIRERVEKATGKDFLG